MSNVIKSRKTKRKITNVESYKKLKNKTSKITKLRKQMSKITNGRKTIKA
jgi:hypothetical protein